MFVLLGRRTTSSWSQPDKTQLAKLSSNQQNPSRFDPTRHKVSIKLMKTLVGISRFYRYATLVFF